MKRLILGLVLLSVPSLTLACGRPVEGPYDEPDNHVADNIASSAALMPALLTANLCAVVALPGDIYLKVQDPQRPFGQLGDSALCQYSTVGVAFGAYMVGGFPYYAGKKVFWDLPAAYLRAFHRTAPPEPNPWPLPDPGRGTPDIHRR